MNIPISRSVSGRLELLYHLAQAFSSSLDLDQVLNRVMDEVIVVMSNFSNKNILRYWQEVQVGKIPNTPLEI